MLKFLLMLLLISSPSYALNLTEPCLAFYKLDDDAATTDVIDEKENHRGTGARNTNLYNTGGRIGGALKFDGANDIVDLQSDFILTEPITICAWINLVGWGENNLGVILTNSRTEFRVNATNTLLQFSSNITAGVISSANNSLSLGSWYFVTVTRTTAGIANLYIDGILSGNADQDSKTPVNGSANISIGARAAASNAFNGSIDNVMIFDKILTPKEIKELYNAGRGLGSLSTLEIENGIE